MPHLTLEFSGNIVEKSNFTALFICIHTLLAQQLPTELSSCKSRWIERENFVVGNNDEDNAFIHLQLNVLPGRTQEKLTAIGKEVMVILEDFFNESLSKLSLQLSLEIDEVKPTYVKKVTKANP